MSIDQTRYALEMAALADRFNRSELLIETTNRYYDYLNTHLTTEQFLEASRIIFETDTYWPSPARFVEAVAGNPKARAELAWDQVVKASSLNPHEAGVAFGNLPSDVRLAVRDLGGLTQIGLADPADLRTKRAAFIRALAPDPAAKTKSDGPRLPGAVELTHDAG